MSEPLATFTLAAAVLAFLWAGDGAAVVGVGAGGRPARPDRVRAARVPRVRGGVRAARAAARRPDRVVAAGIRRGGGARRRVRAADRAVDGARLERRRAVRADQHGRRQGAVHRHLRARQRAASRRQARAHQAPPGAREPERDRAQQAFDDAAAEPRREALPRSAARRRAAEDRPRERGQHYITHQPARLRLDGDREDVAHVAGSGAAGRSAWATSTSRGARARPRRIRAADAAAPLGGAPDRRSALSA